MANARRPNSLKILLFLSFIGIPKSASQVCSLTASSAVTVKSRKKMSTIDLEYLMVQDKSKKEFSGTELFAGKKVMLYFSAHWCPPCRNFTPVLAKFYADAKAAGEPVECVFVSGDNDEESMWSYFTESHGDYYAVPYDLKEREGLTKQYGVNGIPCIVVVDEKGKVIKQNARSDVQEGKIDCIQSWK